MLCGKTEKRNGYSLLLLFLASNQEFFETNDNCEDYNVNTIPSEQRMSWKEIKKNNNNNKEKNKIRQKILINENIAI